MKRHAPSAARNAGPICEVLKDRLPPAGLVLEIASGTGEHIVRFAALRDDLRWLPSDRDPAAVASIQAWVDEARRERGLNRLLDPILFDVEQGDWPDRAIHAIVCINMVHISPWSATRKLMEGAAGAFRRARAADGLAGPLALYGPYRREGVETAQSNEAFDRSLKERNPAWGLRHVEDVAAQGARWGLRLDEVIEMPANNLMLIFDRDECQGAS